MWYTPFCLHKALNSWSVASERQHATPQHLLPGLCGSHSHARPKPSSHHMCDTVMRVALPVDPREDRDPNLPAHEQTGTDGHTDCLFSCTTGYRLTLLISPYTNNHVIHIFAPPVCPCVLILSDQQWTVFVQHIAGVREREANTR